LTSLLALGLQHHALEQQPPGAEFSPTKDAIVDPSGWPREARPEPSAMPRVELGRSRSPTSPSAPGA
jgi:hypothetical protein